MHTCKHWKNTKHMDYSSLEKQRDTNPGLQNPPESYRNGETSSHGRCCICAACEMHEWVIISLEATEICSVGKTTKNHAQNHPKPHRWYKPFPVMGGYDIVWPTWMLRNFPMSSFGAETGAIRVVFVGVIKRGSRLWNLASPGLASTGDPCKSAGLP